MLRDVAAHNIHHIGGLARVHVDQVANQLLKVAAVRKSYVGETRTYATRR